MPCSVHGSRLHLWPITAYIQWPPDLGLQVDPKFLKRIMTVSADCSLLWREEFVCGEVQTEFLSITRVNFSL